MDRRSLIKIATVCFVLLGVTAFSILVYRDFLWLSEPDLVDSGAVVHRDQSAVVKVDDLLKANFFGQHKEGKTRLDKSQSKAPETRLKLELRGVFSSSNPDAGSALIAEKNKSAKYYRVGDELPGGAVLNLVATDHVRLKRNSIDETLSFTPLKTSNGDPASAIDNLVTENNLSSESIGGSSQNRSDSLRERLRQLRGVQRGIEQQEMDN